MRAWGSKRLQFRPHGFDGHHAVVQKENLPAAIQLALDGVADDAFVVLHHDGFDRQAVVRRRLDGAHVARAGEREVKRARNRRGAERQHVHKRAQPLEFFLVQHAEALLLVNHHQPKFLEHDVALNQPVRADDDVHRAGRQIPDDALLFAMRAEAREQFDAHRVIRHAFAERVEMLLRQNGRRHQHGNLLAAHHGFERGANGDFGLAKTDVAANQTVHRLGAFHVGFRFADGAKLVRRFLENERALEFTLPRHVRRKGMAGLRFAHGLDLQQFGGDIADGALGLFLRLVPARAAERVERRTHLAHADVFADEMRLGDGHVKFRRFVAGMAGRVFDDEALGAG